VESGDVAAAEERRNNLSLLPTGLRIRPGTAPSINGRQPTLAAPAAGVLPVRLQPQVQAALRLAVAAVRALDSLPRPHQRSCLRTGRSGAGFRGCLGKELLAGSVDAGYAPEEPLPGDAELGQRGLERARRALLSAVPGIRPPSALL